MSEIANTPQTRLNCVLMGRNAMGDIVPLALDANNALLGGSGNSSTSFGNQSANMFFGGPTTGIPAAPVFRVLTAADLPAAVAVHCMNSGAESVSSSTWTALIFDTNRYDPNSMHTTAGPFTGRLTAPVAGKYRVGGNIGIETGTGVRILKLLLNGATVIGLANANATGAGYDTVMEVAAEWDFAIGDYVEILAFQDSGGALNVRTTIEFWMSWMGA